jgi:hypothetical protein
MSLLLTMKDRLSLYRAATQAATLSVPSADGARRNLLDSDKREVKLTQSV